jgi:hypothetical protein
VEGGEEKYRYRISPGTNEIFIADTRSPYVFLGAFSIADLSSFFQGKSEINQLELIIDLLGTPNDHIWPEFSSLPALQVASCLSYPSASFFPS